MQEGNSTTDLQEDRQVQITHDHHPWNKMDGNVRILEVHPVNDSAASELKQHMKDRGAQDEIQ